MKSHLLHSMETLEEALSQGGAEKLIGAREKMMKAVIHHAEKIEARKQRMQESIENGAKLTRHRLPV